MSQESLAPLLADLHAERLRTWDPAALKINIDQRATLVEEADPSAWVKAGDRVEPFTLLDVEGGELTLKSLTARGPAVLVFFRFAGCPACNIALPYYERALQPTLKALGVPLVAVSPQIPERLGEIRVRHALSFKVVTDPGNALGRRFGILYTADEASQAAQRAKGGSIGETTGTGTWELPQPAVVVIGRDQVVKFADVSPDWLVRTEAEPVIAAVRALAAVPAN
ncbi:peroxiredoxin-like family protein [Caulobacter sp. LARHSG274]